MDAVFDPVTADLSLSIQPDEVDGAAAVDDWERAGAVRRRDCARGDGAPARRKTRAMGVLLQLRSARAHRGSACVSILLGRFGLIKKSESVTESENSSNRENFIPDCR